MHRPITRPRALKLGAALALLVLLGSVAWSWFRGKPMPQALWSKPLLRRECIDHADERACVRACDRGVLDEGGCVGAKQYERACRSGNIQGCQRWQETSTGLGPHRSSKAYLAWLAPTGHACELGHVLSCGQIAHAALGVDAPRARAALARYCGSQAEDSKGECLREGEHRVASVEERSPVCARGDARACGDLAVLALDAYNFVLAGEALASVCRLRGLDALLGKPVGVIEDPSSYFPLYVPEGASGNCARFLIEKNEIVWKENAAALEPSPVQPAASTVLPKVSLTEIDPVAMTDALRPVIAENFTSFARCSLPALAKRKATGLRAEAIVSIRLIVDRLGDPWFVGVSWKLTPKELPTERSDLEWKELNAMHRCIVSHVRATWHVRPPPPEAVYVHAALHLGN